MASLKLVPTLITVDRDRFKLSLWRMGPTATRYKRVKRYEVATGAVGRATDAGMYFVQSKTHTPDWLVPDWADPSIAGTIIPFDDPRNPFAGGFISLGGSEGLGIHGTKFDPELGTRASHGCIRMATPELLELYYQTPLGCPVFIH